MSASTTASRRIQSVDCVRGVVMVLMALDHVRYFFMHLPYRPEDVEHASLALFLTRWVTHFCAPVFFFLAGASASFSARSHSPADVRRHLLGRGILLIVLELTLVGFGWVFRPGYSFAGVIWALGWSMIILGVVARARVWLTATISIAVIALHDLLRVIDPSSLGAAETLWRFLHVTGTVRPFGANYFVLFPLIPWVAVMTLGYASGRLWDFPAERRVRIFTFLGSGMVTLFIVLRMVGLYGEPHPFIVHDSPVRTLMSFLNTTKYPPSLQYLLMTLGPALVTLAVLDRWLESNSRGTAVVRPLIVFGRVPMFYYVCHLYVIHITALIVALIEGQPHQWLSWNGSDEPQPGYGHGLSAVYGYWLLTLLLLYVLSTWFDGVKRRRRSPWLRYI